MDIVAQEKGKNKRYLPHTLSTKEGAVKLYRQTKDIDFVLRRYHISKASLMRWNKAYDGTKESLTAKSSPCFPAVREGKRPAKSGCPVCIPKKTGKTPFKTGRFLHTGMLH